MKSYKLTDTNIPPRALVSHDFQDSIKGLLELAPKEIDQVQLIAKEDYKTLFQGFQKQWDPYFPLHTSMAQDGHALDCSGKTDQEIRAWFDSLPIEPGAMVVSRGLAAPWSIVKNNWQPLIKGTTGVDALDGSWRIFFINEGPGHVAFLQCNEMNV